MKGIEFRVWDKSYKQYAKPYAICLDGRAIVVTEPCNDLETLDSERVIIEQYTGIKDKNGKMIYEGDIVRYAIRPSRTTVVEWWSGEEEYYPCNTTSGFALPYSEDGYEVIGNIHEPRTLGDKE